MHFSRITAALGLGGILYLLSGSLYAAPTVSMQARCYHPHHLYFDLGVGKTYDYAHSNSFLESPNGTVLGNLRTGNSYSTPFSFVGIGYRWTQDYPWLPSVNVGLQHRYTSPINVFGSSQIASVAPKYSSKSKVVFYPNIF